MRSRYDIYAVYNLRHSYSNDSFWLSLVEVLYADLWLQSFELTEAEENPGASIVNEIRRGPNGAVVQVGIGRANRSFEVPSGTLQQTSWAHDFVATRYHDELLSDMMQSHMVHDFCVIGPRVIEFHMHLIRDARTVVFDYY